MNEYSNVKLGSYTAENVHPSENEHSKVSPKCWVQNGCVRDIYYYYKWEGDTQKSGRDAGPPAQRRRDNTRGHTSTVEAWHARARLSKVHQLEHFPERRESP